MPGRGYNPLVGFDSGNPPPGANNHHEVVPRNFCPFLTICGGIIAVPPILPSIQSDNNVNESTYDSETEYIYAPRHCTLHIFQSATKPVLSPTGPPPKFNKYTVATCMTMAELIETLGCKNKDKKKNILYEFIEKGGGRWSGGMVFRGDNVDRMSKRLDYFGWNESRNGEKNPFIWLWVTSDGE